jgi:hypothetical protein
MPSSIRIISSLSIGPIGSTANMAMPLRFVGEDFSDEVDLKSVQVGKGGVTVSLLRKRSAK